MGLDYGWRIPFFVQVCPLFSTASLNRAWAGLQPRSFTVVLDHCAMCDHAVRRLLLTSAVVQAAVALPVVVFLLVAPPVALDNMRGPDMDELMDEAVGQEEAEEADTPGTPMLGLQKRCSVCLVTAWLC